MMASPSKDQVSASTSSSASVSPLTAALIGEGSSLNPGTPGAKKANSSGAEADPQVSGSSTEHLEDDPIKDILVAAQPQIVPKAECTPDQLKTISVNELMEYGYRELFYIVDWAKKVPGFSDLCTTDQMSLLKSSFMELNVLRLSYRSMGLGNSIKFAEGIILSVDYCESMGWGKELISGTIDFAGRLNAVQLDLTEFCVLNAIVLLYPDAEGISSKIHIADLQSQILDCLRRHVARQYPDDTKRFGNILLQLPALRVLSAKAAERFMSLSFDGAIQINELVLEMIN